jgi:Fe-S cluster assembly protein SufD
VLRDTAKAVHRSLVHIAPDAHDCEGYERQDTLLLSDGAQINAVPNLEINNNQVKCSHGATTTYIDDEKLFYFLSRGLDRQSAEELFVSGYVAPVMEKVNAPIV